MYMYIYRQLPHIQCTCTYVVLTCIIIYKYICTCTTVQCTYMHGKHYLCNTVSACVFQFISFTVQRPHYSYMDANKRWHSTPAGQRRIHQTHSKTNSEMLTGYCGTSPFRTPLEQPKSVLIKGGVLDSGVCSFVHFSMFGPQFPDHCIS